jgi:hypothetical protein
MHRFRTLQWYNCKIQTQSAVYMIKHSDTSNYAICNVFIVCKKRKHIGTETCVAVKSPLSKAGNNQIMVRSITRFIPSQFEMRLVNHQEPAVC